ncbi:MAG: SbcC/MukB-like Walker B domain-containing protein [Candidatus Enteromonas sp.]|nr:SbcC/MukB-like Walker B domain-containing protein [Candidatus Enteromonas sp.]
MKKIKKLRLINWHFFDDQEINFSDINVITGENGTGKSTILDAIHYLQSGGSCKFNYAANSLSSGRTVENYLKARIGGEKKEFIRDAGDIIGHIAIEYENTTSRRPFVLGCVLQLSGGQLLAPIFYKIDGDTYNDNLFFTKENEVKNYDELERTAKSMGLPLTIIGQKRQSEKARRKAVFDALGVSEKYETLFAKAIGFEPLQDISRFATDFLLPEAKLDLSSIKDSMDAYRDIQHQVKMEQTRAEELKPIADYKDRYEESLVKEAALQILLETAHIQMHRQAISKNEEAIRLEQAHCLEYKKKAEEASKQAAEEDASAERIRTSDEFKEIKRLTDAKNGLIAEVDRIKRIVAQWETQIRNESNLAHRIGTSLDLSGVLARKDYDAYLSTLSAYRDRISALRAKNDDARSELLGQIKAKKAELEKLRLEIAQLDSNMQGYDSYVDNLLKRIKEAIQTNHGLTEGAEPVCLCTFLDINDPEWRDAIEGLLDKRRFDFFVKKPYRKTADEVFSSDPRAQDYFGVGVIHLDQEGNVANPGSLALKIDAFRINPDGSKSEFRQPREYINFLLGDVYCVDSIDQFVSGKKAITKEGVYFDGESIRFVSAAAMKKPFIGQEAKKQRLAKARDEYSVLDKEIKQLDSELQRLKQIADEMGHSNINHLLDEPNHWSDLISYSKRLEDTITEIKRLESINGDLVRLAQEVQAHLEKARKLRAQAAQFDNKKSDSDREQGRLENENENLSRQIAECEAKIEAMKQNFPRKDLDLDQYLMNLAEGKTGLVLRDFARQLNGTVSNQKQIAERAIRDAINLYCANHPGEMVNDISNYMDFVRRYYKITNDDLAKLTPDLEEAYQRSVSELREHFISRIRNSLAAAKQTIDALNRTLRRHPFGTEEEIFEFITSRSKDPLLGGVYHIAMETNQDTVTDNLFVDTMDADSQEIMNEIFEILSKPEDDPDTRDLRKEITDYRSYLHYDIRIRVSDGNDRLYSENYDAKSGGETQTPFYALIAGAFQSILADSEKNGRSPTDLVLFDEAFNNMDGGRIKQMLEFYKELNVQLIISVPSSRLSYISPYVSNITCLAKDGYAVAIYQARSSGNAQ